jgi:hypothetical protein
MDGFFSAPLTVTTAALTVAVGPARGVRFATHPSGCLGGVPCTVLPSIQLVDGVGNDVAVANVDVTATLVNSVGEYPVASLRINGATALVRDPALELAGSVTATTNATGGATLQGLSVTYAGTMYRIQASAASLGSVVVSQPFDVRVGAVTLASIIQQPSGLVASLPFQQQPIVAVTDAGGNWLAGTSESVTSTMTIQCNDATAPCTSFGNATVQSSDGVARFTDLGTYRAGQMQLRFRLASVLSCNLRSCLTPSQQKTVIPGSPQRLAILTSVNETICAGVALPDIIVQVQDAAGNPVQDSETYVITLVLPAYARGTGITGQTQMTAVQGSANFSGLSIRRSCGSIDRSSPLRSCYNLTFTTSRQHLSGSRQYFTVTSGNFSVLAGTAVDLAFLTQPSGTSVGTAAGRPSVQLVDMYENPILALPSRLTAVCGANFSVPLPSVTTNNYAGENLAGNLLVLGEEKKRCVRAFYVCVCVCAVCACVLVCVRVCVKIRMSKCVLE